MATMDPEAMESADPVGLEKSNPTGRATKRGADEDETPPRVRNALAKTRYTEDDADAEEANDRTSKRARASIATMVAHAYNVKEFLDVNGRLPSLLGKDDKDVIFRPENPPEEATQTDRMSEQYKLGLVRVVESDPSDIVGTRPTVWAYQWKGNWVIPSKSMSVLETVANWKLVEDWTNPTDAIIDTVNDVFSEALNRQPAVGGSPDDVLATVMGDVVQELEKRESDLKAKDEALSTASQHIQRLTAQLSAATSRIKEAERVAKSATKLLEETKAASAAETKAFRDRLQEQAQAYVRNNTGELQNKLLAAQRENTRLANDLDLAKERVLATALGLGVAATETSTIDGMCGFIDVFVTQQVVYPFTSMKPKGAMAAKNGLFAAALTTVYDGTKEIPRDAQAQTAANWVAKKNAATQNVIAKEAPQRLRSKDNAYWNLGRRVELLAGHFDAKSRNALRDKSRAVTTETKLLRLGQACDEMDTDLTRLSGRTGNETHLDILTSFKNFFSFGNVTASAKSLLSSSTAIFGNSIGDWFGSVYSKLMNGISYLCPAEVRGHYIEKTPANVQPLLQSAQALLQNSEPCIAKLGNYVVPQVIDLYTDTRHNAATALAGKATAEEELKKTKEATTAALESKDEALKAVVKNNGDLVKCLVAVSEVKHVKAALPNGASQSATPYNLAPAVQVVSDTVDTLQTEKASAQTEVTTLTTQAKQAQLTAEEAKKALILERNTAEEAKRTTELALAQATRQYKYLHDQVVAYNAKVEADEAAAAQDKAKSAVVVRPMAPAPAPEVKIPSTFSDPSDERAWSQADAHGRVVFVLSRQTERPWNEADIALLAQRMNSTPAGIRGILATMTPTPTPQSDATPVVFRQRTKKVTRTAGGGGGGDPDDNRAGTTTVDKTRPNPSKLLTLPLGLKKPTSDPPPPPPPRGPGGLMNDDEDDNAPSVLAPEKKLVQAAGGPPPPPPPSGSTVVGTQDKPKTRYIHLGPPRKNMDDSPIEYPDKKPAVASNDITADLLWRVRFLQNLLSIERVMMRRVVTSLHHTLTDVLTLMAYVCPKTELQVPSYAQAKVIHTALTSIWDAPEPNPQAFSDAATPSKQLEDAWEPRKPVRDSAKDKDVWEGDTFQVPTGEETESALAKKKDYVERAQGQLQVRRKAVENATRKNQTTLSTYATYVETALEHCIEEGHVDWCSLLSIVEADDINATTVVRAVAKSLHEAGEHAQLLQLGLDSAAADARGQAQLVLRFATYYANALLANVQGEEEKMALEQNNVVSMVKDMTTAVNGKQTSVSDLRTMTTQVMGMLMLVSAAGRKECNAVIRSAYQQAAAPDLGAVVPAGVPPLVLDRATVARILSRSASTPMSQLIHWRQGRPEAASWSSDLYLWGMPELTKFVTLPQDLFPAIIEQMHARLGGSFNSLNALALDFFGRPRGNMELALSGMKLEGPLQKLCPSTFRFYDLDLDDADQLAFPFPFDVHTLVVTGLSFDEAQNKLQDYFTAAAERVLVNNARVELVCVDEQGRYRDVHQDVEIYAGRSGRPRLTLRVVRSEVRSHEQYLLRLRWLRTTRMLREFDVLSKQSLEYSRRILSGILSTGAGTDVLVDLPILENAHRPDQPHGANALVGKPENAAITQTQMEHDLKLVQQRAVAVRR